MSKLKANKVFIILFTLVVLSALGVILFNQPKEIAEKIPQYVTTQENKIKEDKKVEVLVKGIKRPHGIGQINGKIHVSSETDKALFKIEDNKAEKVATLDFAHDMFGWSRDLTIIAVFNENRLVEVDPEGNIKTILRGLGGPNGLTYDPESQIYFISNYNLGTVISFKKDNLTPQIIAKNLKGPAGLTFDSLTRRLYIANYLDGSITIVTDKSV